MFRDLAWWQVVAIYLFCISAPTMIKWFNADEVKNNKPPTKPRPTSFREAPRDISLLVQSELATQRANEKAIRKAKGAATEAYWNAKVAFMHRLRFAVQDSDQPFGEYFLGGIKEYQTAIQKTRISPVPDSTATGPPEKTPDPELVSMVKRHIAFDEQGLELLLQLRKMNSDAEILKQKMPAKDQIAFGNWIVNNIDLEKLPPELQAILKQLMAMQERQFEILYEIEIMQAVLKERYPGTQFSLPDLETAP